MNKQEALALLQARMQGISCRTRYIGIVLYQQIDGKAFVPWASEEEAEAVRLLTRNSSDRLPRYLNSNPGEPQSFCCFLDHGMELFVEVEIKLYHKDDHGPSGCEFEHKRVTLRWRSTLTPSTTDILLVALRIRPEACKLLPADSFIFADSPSALIVAPKTFRGPNQCGEKDRFRHLQDLRNHFIGNWEDARIVWRVPSDSKDTLSRTEKSAHFHERYVENNTAGYADSIVEVEYGTGGYGSKNKPFLLITHYGPYPEYEVSRHQTYIEAGDQVQNVLRMLHAIDERSACQAVKA